MVSDNLERQRSTAMADEELIFERPQWAELRASTPLELGDSDLAELRGINERLDLDEVAEVYLPLSLNQSDLSLKVVAQLTGSLTSTRNGWIAWVFLDRVRKGQYKDGPAHEAVRQYVALHSSS